MRKSIILTAAAAIILSGCAPKLTGSLSSAYPALDEKADVVILDNTSKAPEKSIKIGSISVTPGKFTPEDKSSYNSLLESAVKHAKTRGGNIIRITDYLPQGADAIADHIWMDVYYLKDLTGLKSITSAPAPSKFTEIRDIYNLKRPSALPYTFRFAINCGTGRSMMANYEDPYISPEMYNHNNKMNLGFTVSAEASVFFDYNNGFGLKVHNYHSSSTDDIYVMVTNQEHTVSYRESRDITYVGPFYSIRVMSGNQKHTFLANVGAGCLFYNNRIKADMPTQKLQDNVPFKTLAANLGGSLGLEYDYALTDNISLGAGMDYMLGVAARSKITNLDGSTRQDNGTKFDLSSLSFNIGVRFCL